MWAVIATLVNAAALAAKAATTTTPIVFLVSEDPVRLGLFASLARPGGNMTGVNVLFAELVAKRLGLLHDLVPKAVRVAVLVNPTNTANAEATLREIPEAALGLGLQIQVINASTSHEIDAAFASLAPERPDALEFIALRGGAAAWPLVARAQQAAMPAIAPHWSQSIGMVAIVGMRNFLGG